MTPEQLNEIEDLESTCFACGCRDARYEIREMSSRCGQKLCEACKQGEERTNAAWRWLSN